MTNDVTTPAVNTAVATAGRKNTGGVTSVSTPFGVGQLSTCPRPSQPEATSAVGNAPPLNCTRGGRVNPNPPFKIVMPVTEPLVSVAVARAHPWSRKIGLVPA